jgi:hypothetical protein
VVSLCPAGGVAGSEDQRAAAPTPFHLAEVESARPLTSKHTIGEDRPAAPIGGWPAKPKGTIKVAREDLYMDPSRRRHIGLSLDVLKI